MPLATTPEGAAASSAIRQVPVRWALTALSLSMLLSSLGISIVNIALPTLAQVFGAPFQQVQWVVLAYLLTITTLVVSVGRLGDIVGRRRLLLSGILLFTAGTALGGAAPTLALLIAARTVQGLGAAVMIALTMAFVGEIVPKQRTGNAMGLLGTMSAAGTALGPSLGGMLIAWAGWRMIFVVIVPLGVLALLLARRALPADRAVVQTERKGFDVPGTLLLVLTLATYTVAMTFGRDSFGVFQLALLSASVCGVGLFLYVEARAASPLFRPAMLRNPVLGAGLAMSVLVSTVLMATLIIGPFYLSGSLGLDAAGVGLVVSVGPVAVVLTGMPAGRAVDRFGAGRITIAGLVAIAIGCAALSILPETLGIAGYLVPIVTATIGYALFQTANNTAIMADVALDRRGVVSGMLTLSRNLGLVTGASVLGAVFAFASTATDIMAASPEAVATGMRTTFAVAAGLVIVAILCAFGGRAFATRLSQGKAAL